MNRFLSACIASHTLRGVRIASIGAIGVMLLGNVAWAAIPFQFYFVFQIEPPDSKRMRSDTFFKSELMIDLANSAASGDTNRIKALLAKGADVNGVGLNGMNPLFWALINRNIQGFRFLLENGADPNATFYKREPYSENALTLAASLEESEFIEALLAKGAKPDLPVSVKTANDTPLIVAAHYRNTNNIAVLLKHGANLEWRTVSGATPFHIAIEEGSFEVALFLLKLGANPNLKDRWGYSAIDTLRTSKDKGVITTRDRAVYKVLIKELRLAGYRI